jgi:hypothetical protein
MYRWKNTDGKIPMENVPMENVPMEKVPMDKATAGMAGPIHFRSFQEI